MDNNKPVTEEPQITTALANESVQQLAQQHVDKPIYITNITTTTSIPDEESQNAPATQDEDDVLINEIRGMGRDVNQKASVVSSFMNYNNRSHSLDQSQSKL